MYFSSYYQPLRPRTYPAKKPIMIPPSRAQSDVFSASQYGPPVEPQKPYIINYFIIPIFILEVIGLACLWALFYYMIFTDVFPHHQRVFFCDDRDLQYPDLEPSDYYMSVSYEVLFCCCFILPFAVILIGELMFWLFSTKPRKVVFANCRSCKVHLFTRRLLRFTAVFMFGALIVCIFVYTIKFITGYQRPYFLTMCSPGPEACGTTNQRSQELNPLIQCQYDQNRYSQWDLRQGWLSFPSLYAALSLYCAIFVSIYIYYMVRMRGAPLLRPFLIAGFLGMALIASFSRVQGYKNSWVDIWVGWLIGALWAFFLSYNVLNFQEMHRIVEEKIEIEEEEVRSPFFSWFKLPRVTASVYTQESPPPPTRQRARDTNRTYEVTTTTESFQRTIAPPGHGGIQY